MTLDNIRKVFRLLERWPYQNKDTYEAFDRFFLEWELYLKDRLNLAKEEQQAAEEELRKVQSNAEYYVSAKDMKDDLKLKHRALKNANLETKRAKAALERGYIIYKSYNKSKRR